MRRKIVLVLHFVNQNRVFWHWNHLKVIKSWMGKKCIYGWSKNSLYNQPIILPVEFNVVQIRHLIPVCVHVLCAYTWMNFVPHLHSPFLVGNNWNSRYMIIQNFLSLRQQGAPSGQKNFLGTYCRSLDEIFYSQSNWVWYKVKRPLNTVVGDWRNYVALL